MLVCAGKIEYIKDAVPIGVGMIESAISLTTLCIQKKPKRIIFVGTAGSYGKFSIFEIVESRLAVNIEHSFLFKSGYTPLDLIINDLVSHETIVNSSNYITCNKSASDRFIELGIDIENMEFYSVVSVANRFDIDVKGIFVITNYCFEDARDEFKTNHKRCIKLLEEYIHDK